MAAPFNIENMFEPNIRHKIYHSERCRELENTCKDNYNGIKNHLYSGREDASFENTPNPSNFAKRMKDEEKQALVNVVQDWYNELLRKEEESNYSVMIPNGSSQFVISAANALHRVYCQVAGGTPQLDDQEVVKTFIEVVKNSGSKEVHGFKLSDGLVLSPQELVEEIITVYHIYYTYFTHAKKYVEKCKNDKETYNGKLPGYKLLSMFHALVFLKHLELIKKPLDKLGLKFSLSFGYMGEKKLPRNKHVAIFFHCTEIEKNPNSHTVREFQKVSDSQPIVRKFEWIKKQEIKTLPEAWDAIKKAIDETSEVQFTESEKGEVHKGSSIECKVKRIDVEVTGLISDEVMFEVLDTYEKELKHELLHSIVSLLPTWDSFLGMWQLSLHTNLCCGKDFQSFRDKPKVMRWSPNTNEEETLRIVKTFFEAQHGDDEGDMDSIAKASFMKNEVPEMPEIMEIKKLKLEQFGPLPDETVVASELNVEYFKVNFLRHVSEALNMVTDEFTSIDSLRSYQVSIPIAFSKDMFQRVFDNDQTQTGGGMSWMAVHILAQYREKFLKNFKSMKVTLMPVWSGIERTMFFKVMLHYTKEENPHDNSHAQRTLDTYMSAVPHFKSISPVKVRDIFPVHGPRSTQWDLDYLCETFKKYDNNMLPYEGDDDEEEEAGVGPSEPKRRRTRS